MSSRIRSRTLGVAFLALVLGFVWVTYAVFNKTFVSYDDVTLRSSKLGLQLPSRADVKLRGVIVGEVRSVRATDDGAELVLGLYPDQRESIPADVTARILPKTLFGEKFVALDAPRVEGAEPIQPGDTITQAEVAIEVEQVLSDLFPLLQTLQPAALNTTLTALANALEGRGDALGENLEVLDAYLRKFNPQVPALVEDLRQLSTVSEVYRDVAPDLGRILRNSVTTGRTFVDQEAQIQALFAEVTAFSGVAGDVVEENGDNLIRLAEQGEQVLPVFAQHAPIYPCFLEGMVKVAPRQAEAFRGNTLHINLETLPSQPRGYGPQDRPRFDDTRGPVDPALCRRVINDEFSQQNLPPQFLVPDLDDGVDEDTGKGQSPNRAAPTSLVQMTSGWTGTRAEQEIVGSLVGPVMGRSYDEVPAIATLLFGPLARGMEVSVR